MSTLLKMTKKASKKKDNSIQVEIPEIFQELFLPYRFKVYFGGRGSGKCLKVGTKVIMYDGTLKSVEDVAVGDLLMGPDLQPRTVLSLSRGIGQLHKIRQTSGMDYVVNDSHILALKVLLNGIQSDCNIPISEYIGLCSKKKAELFGYRKVSSDYMLTEISVEDAGLGEYAGFALDKDHLFLLEDGTVTHNSWNIADALLLKALESPRRILCAREFQSSISDSVHHLLVTQIDRLGLSSYFNVGKVTITSVNGSSFIFKGLRMNPQEIKSTEDVDICWVEEGQSVSEESWQVLTPTIRKPGSEIWVSFNPLNETDPTYRRFVVELQPSSVVRKVNWNDNPHFPEVLDMERLHMMRTDPDAYEHVWEGNVLRISDAVIYKGKFEVGTFEAPSDARFYHGADWGFAKDPTCLIRCWIQNNILYIDQEAYGVGVDMDAIPALFDGVETARAWPIKADNARPETISHVRGKGFNITAAAKWAGCVEDGIAYIRSFEKIMIHERCKHTAQEFRLYSYKVDRQTGDILPVVVDANNHMQDALRYALDGLIVRKQRETTTGNSIIKGKGGRLNGF